MIRQAHPQRSRSRAGRTAFGLTVAALAVLLAFGWVEVALFLALSAALVAAGAPR